LLTKIQRLVAFYILYKVYNAENFRVTPFESVVLSSINHCMQVFTTKQDSYEAFERRAEYTLLTDFVVSTPKIANKIVQDYINQIEQPAGTGSPQWPQVPNQQATPLQGFRQDEFAELQQPPLIPSSDIKEHIRTHREQMP